jgi:hypothetical protein
VQCYFEDGDEERGVVTDVFVRDWKIDRAMMDIFSRCLPACQRLRSIQFWNTGLDVSFFHAALVRIPLAPS